MNLYSVTLGIAVWIMQPMLQYSRIATLVSTVYAGPAYRFPRKHTFSRYLVNEE